MKWIKPPIQGDQVRQLASQYNLDLLTAAILTRRELTASEQMAFFLEEDERFLHNPFLFPDMEKAVERVLRASEEGEKVLICGDKDTDGITSTVLMVEALRLVGIDPQWRVPMGDEAYGLNPEVLRAKAAENITLIITVDCGITDFEGIQIAEQLGMDVMVFDHHMPRSNQHSDAYAIVNPKVSDAYPFNGLCAVGVVSKFQWALCLARTEMWGSDFCVVIAHQNNNAIQLDAVRIRNLSEVGHCSFSDKDEQIGKEHFLGFIEGHPLLTYGAERQVPLIASLFGGAEVHVMDIAPELAQTFPGLQGRSLEDLAADSRLARYFPNRSGLASALSSLVITFYLRRFSAAFEPWRRGLDLVVLGTLADMMPLINENRILVRMGLNRLNATDGLQERRGALLELLIRQRLHESRVGAVDASWKICPLINASGRMGQANVGVELFLTDNAETKKVLAKKLISLNRKRRSLSEDVWKRIYPQAHKSLESLDGHMVIVSDNEVLRGITGILATRLQKTIAATAVVISQSGDGASGSIRCAPGWNALVWLEAMSELFDDFGGHPQAGGFRMAKGKMDSLISLSKKWLIGQNNPTSGKEPVMVDAELSHDEITRLGIHGMEELLQRLEPYGQGFRPLTFLTRSVQIHRAELIGKPQSDHLKLLVSLGSSKWPAIWWDAANYYGDIIQIGNAVDLLYQFDRDQWRGADSRRLTILEAIPCM